MVFIFKRQGGKDNRNLFYNRLNGCGSCAAKIREFRGIRCREERGGKVEGEALAREGMGERELLGMKIEAVGRLSVEGIAKNGTAEALLM